MSYRFVRKSETPSAERIESAKNFNEALEASKSFSEFGISSSALKGGVTTKTLVLVSVGILVSGSALCFGVLGVNPFPVVKEPVNEDTKIEQQLEKNSQIHIDSLDRAEIKGQVEQLDQVNDEFTSSPLHYEDLLVRASPLPSTEAFLQFVDRELEYPKELLDDSIEGFVEVRFKVNRKGETEDFKISKSLGRYFDEEAIRVIKQYKNWKPATYSGEAQEDFLKLKVTFTLDSN